MTQAKIAMFDDLLKELAFQVNKTARSKGWHLLNRTFGDYVALFHSEVSEAFEAYRDGHRPTEVWLNDHSYMDPDGEDWTTINQLAKEGFKPEGVSVELADIIIRILDYAHANDLDIAKAIRAKMIYNETRPYQHGGKLA